MKRGNKFSYAQLPVFAYQVWDPKNLQFSSVPIIQSEDRPPITDDTIAANYWQSVAANDSDAEQQQEEQGNPGDEAGPSDQTASGTQHRHRNSNLD